MYCNDCSQPVEWCTCGDFSRHKDSKEEKLLREFFTGKKPKDDDSRISAEADRADKA